MKMNYTGKIVYLGIDVHKKKYVIAARCDGELVKTFTQVASPETLVRSLNHWFRGAKLYAVYEAGFSGFGLYRSLTENGFRCIVVNPASVEAAINDRVKTDKRDARKMAELLEVNRLKGIYVPSLNEELARQYQRTRQQLIESRIRLGNQVKSKLFEFGYIESEDDVVASSKYFEAVLKLELPEILRFCLKTLIEQWNSFNKAIKEIEGKIKLQVATGNRQFQIIKSVPGVGDISAAIIGTELIDCLRFRNEKAIFRITGLTPGEYSSGEKIRRGNISRQGSNRLRWVLTEVAWRAIRQDNALKEAFDRISLKRGKKRAIVAIARKIIGRIRACLWNDIEYVTGIYA